MQILAEDYEAAIGPMITRAQSKNSAVHIHLLAALSSEAVIKTYPTQPIISQERLLLAIKEKNATIIYW